MLEEMGEAEGRLRKLNVSFSCDTLTTDPDSKLILAQRWPDVIIYVGPMLENNIGPM